MPAPASFPTPPSSYSHSYPRPSIIKRRLIESDDEIEDGSSDEDCPTRPPKDAPSNTPQRATSHWEEEESGAANFFPSPELAAQQLAIIDPNDGDDYSILLSDDEDIPSFQQLEALHIGTPVHEGSGDDYEILSESSDEFPHSYYCHASHAPEDSVALMSEDEDDAEVFKRLMAKHAQTSAAQAPGLLLQSLPTECMPRR